MIARYAEYVVHINANVDSQMTYERFEEISITRFRKNFTCETSLRYGRVAILAL